MTRVLGVSPQLFSCCVPAFPEAVVIMVLHSNKQNADAVGKQGCSCADSA